MEKQGISEQSVSRVLFPALNFKKGQEIALIWPMWDNSTGHPDTWLKLSAGQWPFI